MVQVLIAQMCVMEHAVNEGVFKTNIIVMIGTLKNCRSLISFFLRENFSDESCEAKYEQSKYY